MRRPGNSQDAARAIKWRSIGTHDGTLDLVKSGASIGLKKAADAGVPLGPRQRDATRTSGGGSPGHADRSLLSMTILKGAETPTPRDTP